MVLVRDIIAGLVGITGTDILLTGLAVTGTEFQLIDKTEVLDERFLIQFPRDSRGREVTPAGFGRETRGSIGTHREREQILVVENVIQTAEPGSQAEFGLAGRFETVLDRITVVVEGSGAPGLTVIPFIGMAEGGIDGMLACEKMLVIEEVVDVVMEAVGGTGRTGSLTAFAQCDHRRGPSTRRVVLADILRIRIVLVAVEGNGRRQVLETVNLVNGGDVGRDAVVLAPAQARIQGTGNLVRRRNRVVTLGIGAEHIETEGLLVIVHAIDGSRAIIGINRTGRIRESGGSNGAAAGRRIFPILAQADIESQVIVQELGIEVERGGQDLLAVAFDNTLGILEAHGSTVRHIGQCTPYGDRVAVVEGRLGNGFLPVAVSIAEQRGIPAAAGVFRTELIRIINIQLLISIVDRIVAAVAYPRSHALSALGLRPPLGCHDDDTVGAPRTVNGSGGSILQHADRLDIIRIDRMDTLTDHAIDDDKRLIGSIQGCTLADTDGTGGTGRTGALGDLQTGDLSEKEVFCRRRFDAVQFIRFHGHDGTGRIGLLNFAVTDDHDFFQELVVLGKQDPARHLGSPVSHRLVADAADINRRIGSGHGKYEIAVHTGGHAIVCPPFHDSCPDDGPLFIGNRTSHLISALGEYGNRRQAEKHDACKECTDTFHKMGYMVIISF